MGILKKKTTTEKERFFDEVFDTHFEKTMFFINGYCNDIETARNLAQDTFITYWENIDKVDHTKNVLPYLLKIAKNKTLNHLYRNNIHKRYTDTVEREELEFALYSLRSSTIEEVYEKNIESILHEALEEMTPSIRETYLLRLRKGMTNLEISKNTGTPLRTVEYRMKKALLILGRKLRDYINAIILFFASLSLW